MDSTQLLSIVSVVLSVGGTFLALVNHHRIRSSCCGRNDVMSLDVESTTPPRPAITA